jgi:hypothetical protein
MATTLADWQCPVVGEPRPPLPARHAQHSSPWACKPRRYSYMGNYLHFGIVSEAHVGEAHAGATEQMEVRNLLNRTRLALGAPPATLPSRDNRGTSKLAAMIYTDRHGSLDAFFDRKALQSMVADGTLDAWAPKPVYVRGEVLEADLREYNGWAKIGCILLTLPDELQSINARLDAIVHRLFFESSRGFLPVEVIDEDGEGSTGLRPSVLLRGQSQPANQGQPGHAKPDATGRASKKAGCCTMS